MGNLTITIRWKPAPMNTRTPKVPTATSLLWISVAKVKLHRRTVARMPFGAWHSTTSIPPVALLKMRSDEHTSELQSLIRISYDVFRLKNKNKPTHKNYKP